ncbi:DUF3347 domain-containing protein [Flavihumibacter petaseus]|uniref:DUF3347 domain-containing protein n=1 Tax=Flavihumibacter petaseus NBRC 106054 TaxID=1220578 RepID=A0A0E9N2B0_9BACT|nr:DUF3347 domain-containing protein [Flavihumibacter petaseus]GAO43974.1 hypothetical protein FPE01S_03_00130 [Flavihumibacter petaseus NBRC 106054]
MQTIRQFFAVTTMALAVPFLAFSQDKTPVNNLLQQYYGIKNALVAGDPAAAAKAATAFTGALQNINTGSLAASEQAALKPVREKLLENSKAIASGKDLAKQRAAFQVLSDNLIPVVKASKVDAPAYIAYCPMKKASWLSAEQAIKNPYYGSAMLTCGSVKETIQ